MPLYDYICDAGHKFERFLPLARYDEAQKCDCGLPATKQLSRPFIAPDLQPYTSPIDDRVISGRAARREDLRRNGCVEWERGMNEEQARRREEREARLEQAVEQTVEAEIHKMPARKREKLEAELSAGADVRYARLGA